MTHSIRTLIVDDEPLARDSIRVLLGPDSDIEIVGECGNGTDAVEAIQVLAPDLVFLDVEMPAMSGFEVLDALCAEELPRVVFVTAYDKYAVRAFEINAVDYLLKPFDNERFRAALDRAKRDLSAPEPSESQTLRILRLLEAERGAGRFDRIAIREAGRIYFVELDDIDWIAGAGNHAELHTAEQSHLHRESLSSLENRLDPRRFLRIHRSTIVRIDRIRELRPRARGDYDVILKDGTSLSLSRRYHDRLSRLIPE